MFRRVLVKTSAMLSDDYDLLECEHWVERIEPYGALIRDCYKCENSKEKKENQNEFLLIP